jgi:UDP-glucose 4-epimerase
MFRAEQRGGGMKIVVAGAAGFIASHLLEQLIKDGHECLGIDDLSIHNGGIPAWIEQPEMDNVKWILGFDGDCTDNWNIHRIFKDFNPDVIANLAVKPLPHSLEHPVNNFETNTKITLNILEWLRDIPEWEKKPRLVNFSSSEVYGTAQKEMINEEHQLRPTTPYAASKASCDFLVQSYVNTYGIDATIVRPFNCVGRRQNDKSYAAIIPLTVKRIKDGLLPIIYGDGTKTRDFTAVEDVVRGAIAVMEHGSVGEVYNICSSVETSVTEIIDLIAEEVGYGGVYQYSDERQGDVTRHLGDNSKARRELGWEPRVSLKEAVRRAIHDK